MENICTLALTLSAPQTVFKTGPNTWGLASVLRAVVKLEKEVSICSERSVGRTFCPAGEQTGLADSIDVLIR